MTLGSCSRRRAHHSRLLFHCHYALAYVQLPLVGEHQLCKLFINGTKTFSWNLRCVMRLCVRMIFISLSLSFFFSSSFFFYMLEQSPFGSFLFPPFGFKFESALFSSSFCCSNLSANPFNQVLSYITPGYFLW